MGSIGRSLTHSLGYKSDSAVYTDGNYTLTAYAKGLINMGWKCVEKSDGACLNGSDDLFTITGGVVRCTIVGLVTTVIGGVVSLRLTHTTVAPAATVNLNAGAVACSSDAVGTIYYNVGATSVFTPSTGLGYAIVDPVTVQETEFLLAPGTVKCLGTAAGSGVIAWYMSYIPLTPNALVEAAA